MPHKYKLSYFNARGYGEPCRLIFALAGVEYEDRRFEREEWNASVKPTSPTGQAPMLEVDGVVYAQSKCIARFLANEFGLAGKSPLDKLRADMIVDTATDMMQPAGQFFYEEDEAVKAAKKAKFQDEQLPNSLKTFENLLVANNGGDGFFVGDAVTWADLFVMHFVTFPPLMGIEIKWADYPKLAALCERVKKIPQIAAWIEKRPKTEM